MDLPATWLKHSLDVHCRLLIGWRSQIPGFTLPYLCADKPTVSHAEFFRREVDPTHQRTQHQSYVCEYATLRRIAEYIGAFHAGLAANPASLVIVNQTELMISMVSF